MRFSSLVDRIGGEGSRAWGIHAAAMRRRAEGRPVILLTIGDHDFDGPAAAVEATVDALRAGRHHYTPAAGDADLRAAIAGWHGRLTGLPATVENVVVLPGAQSALYTAAMCLFGPGDTILAADPMYATYEATLRASGAAVRGIRLKPENGFHLDPADVAAAIDGSVRGLVLNLPHNPTGAVATPEELAAIARLCADHDLAVISDEVYATMTYERRHVSIAAMPGMAGRTAVLGSLSKSHAMTGWRIGWAVAPADLIGHMANLAGCMFFGLPPFAQDGAVAALGAGADETAALCELYRRRRDAVARRLDGAAGLAFNRPEGGMFFMLDIRATSLTAQAFAERLLVEEDVAVTPGDGFGAGGAGHVRLSLSADEPVLAEACGRIVRFAARLTDAPAQAK